jgi:hypothetical protein
MTQIPNGRTEEEQKLVLAKRQLEKLIYQFHDILADKTLINNKTQAQLKLEGDVALRLLPAANEVDVLNILNGPEGTFGLFALLLRIGLTMRDGNNRLEYEIRDLHRKFEKLEKQIMDMSSAGQRNG